MDVESLERILRAYGVSTDRGTLKAAFEDPEHGTAFAEWATLHLGPNTLLSRDELSLSVLPCRPPLAVADTVPGTRSWTKLAMWIGSWQVGTCQAARV